MYQCFNVFGKECECKDLQLIYQIDTNYVMYPGDTLANWFALGNDKFEIHIGPGIRGYYQLSINDSLFYEGKLAEDAYIGYNKESFILPKYSNAIITFYDVKSNCKIKIPIETNWKHIVFDIDYNCNFIINYRNKVPFKG